MRRTSMWMVNSFVALTVPATSAVEGRMNGWLDTRRGLRVMVVTAGLLLWIAPGCAGPTHPLRPVCESCRIVCGECEQSDRFVRLEIPSATLHQSRDFFSHPARFRPEDLDIILSTIQVQSQGNALLFLGSPKEQITAAFTVEEVNYLSKTLSQALARAQPNEWVIFGLSRQQSSEVAEITTGGWYVRGTDLHLVLANYRFAVTAPTIRELVWENPLSTQGVTYNLVPGNYQSVVSSYEGLLRPSPKELSIAYEPLLLGEPPVSRALRHTVPGSAVSPPPDKVIRPYATLEERLQTLKRLKEQGLITEEEYQAKKKQQLDPF